MQDRRDGAWLVYLPGDTDGDPTTCAVSHAAALGLLGRYLAERSAGTPAPRPRWFSRWFG